MAQQVWCLAHDFIPFLLAEKLLLVVNFEGGVQEILLVSITFGSKRGRELLVHLIDLAGFAQIVLAIGCEVHQIHPYLTGSAVELGSRRVF